MEELWDWITTSRYLSKPKESNGFIHKSHIIRLSKTKFISIKLSVCKNLNVKEYNNVKSKYIFSDNKVMDFEFKDNILTYTKYSKKYTLVLFSVNDNYFFKYDNPPKWIIPIKNQQDLCNCKPNTPILLTYNEN